ncbi:HD domain-containing phosphohydrolase [Candidatus Desulforudis audaxviator]|uniref:Metal dependent phosphohydrolase n=1 Tax=Desulforudis audaxviator (strain MP104C) TaxID=477974 RepID=B1I3C6_DESAP|nr:HD domain-containing phosphohydrolase [Candidatus Desulforudis audaxviator]ACA59491.1 metal dependent phosphohydrolase [Candidatus Desulforudis audaxviator MP104C]AZK59474.1 metal dependent phosphohydrolase [Candidatus Desulforudis audaxviator]
MSEIEFRLAALEERIRELETVLEVSGVISATLDADRIMDVVLDACMGAVSAEAGTLWILDDEYLLPVATRGPKADRLQELKLKKGEGLAGQVCEGREPVFVEDVTRDERWASHFGETTGFITRSMLVVPLFTEEKSVGSLQLINKLDGALFNDADLRISRALALHSAKVIVNSRRHVQQRRFLNSLLAAVADLLDARDPRAKGHSERVSQYALLIAQELGLDPEEQDLVQWASLLHDVGKITVPEEILAKAHPLDVRAWEQINQHPIQGGNIIIQLRPKSLTRYLWAGVRYHHERYDGNGFPTGLSGEDIPLVARIIAIANAFDNMVSTERYGPAVAAVEALEEIERCAGTCYDPKLVDAFVCAMRSRLTATQP